MTDMKQSLLETNVDLTHTSTFVSNQTLNNNNVSGKKKPKVTDSITTSGCCKGCTVFWERFLLFIEL